MDRDFRNALDAVIAEITPQSWDWTDHNGATLTVIPDGLKASPGEAEVLLQITAGKTLAAQLGISTAELPGLIDALSERRPWDGDTILDSLITVTPADGVLVVIAETVWEERDNHAVSTSILLPEAQRLPFASALRRALDVARGWED